MVQSKPKQIDVITVSLNKSSKHLGLPLSSCMPLHPSIGLGKQALKIVLDKTIKEADDACPELAEAF